MKRFLLAIISFFIFAQFSWANHITGGQIFYTFVSQSNGSYTYNVTLLLYRDHFSSGAQLDDVAAMGVYDEATGSLVWNADVPRTDTFHLHLISPSPCISNPPVVWYEVGRYQFTISLPKSSLGYIIVYQRCCRIQGINNLDNSSSVGATYTAEIPGYNILTSGPENNSAHFSGIDTVAICANYPFTYDFGAIDPDGDTLSYSFCNAYLGGSTSVPVVDPPLGPPYFSVPYAFPFSGTSPMGSSVTIDPVTGRVSGIAPVSGIYVVTVCVTEKRNGIIIATQRKDLQIKVADCQIALATLEQPNYRNCRNYTVSFQNLTPSPLINTYFWDFGVTGSLSDTSNLPSPTFTYPDTGTYVVKLVTNRNQDCSDSTTSLVKIYPGFTPNFTFAGVCINNPTQFTDASVAAYGTINSWNWSFGDGGTSNIRNPQHSYTAAGTKNVTLIVTSSKGCIDTAHQVVNMIDKPLITLAFRDTLICIPDQLQLNASGQGVFSWTPLTNITNANTGTPTVNPTTTTTYHVTLNDNSCINDDSVRVRVVAGVALRAKPDTTVCAGDPVQLGAQTDGLAYSWTPTTNLSDPTLLNPIATPPTTTTYTLLTTIGTCFARDDMTIFVVPYPGSNAGPDDTMCYNTSARLTGTIVGSSFNWSPTNSMIGANTLNPTVYPARTTAYVLTVYDTLGCPKPGRDTIVVTVTPRMHPFAGRDTSVVVGQPLQFNASGGVSYLWSPSTGLSAIDIPNPIGTYTNEVTTVRYKVVMANPAGCLDSAYVNVKVFKTGPRVFVPTAFTPNGDGLNDVIRPIAVGIQKIEYFSIYNRWGQLVFTTTINGQGWDGKIGSKEQGSNVFVWMVKAIDYLGKAYFQKGTVTLIR